MGHDKTFFSEDKVMTKKMTNKNYGDKTEDKIIKRYFKSENLET